MFDNQASALPTVVQRRGIERVQAILDAASALLAEQGYDAATLKAVGERAGIPTASMYHYFPDRHQVDAALAQRHLRDLDAQISASVRASKLRSLADAVDAVVDPYLTYFREHADFVQLWFASRTPTLSELATEFDEFQARQYWQVLIEKGLIRSDTPELVVQLAFEAGNRLFDFAFRRSPSGDDVAIDEARRLLTAYLGTYAQKSPTSRR